MLPTSSAASLKRRYKEIFQHMPSYNQHFPGTVMPQELSAEEPTAQRGGCVTAASPGVQHIQEKGQNNKEKKAFDLCSELNYESAKPSQQFLYSSTGTSAHFKAVVLIITHACVVREEDSPASLRAGLTLPPQGSKHPLDPELHTRHHQTGIM